MSSVATSSTESTVATPSTEYTVCTIFIKNLDKAVDHKKLFDTFSVYGKITTCKVSAYSNGTSRGYAFVNFQTMEEAERAVLEGNGMSLAGNEIIVEKFRSRTEKKLANLGENLKFTNVCVKNLGEEIDDVKLRTIFEEFGEITSCAVKRDGNKKSRGFGFVAFKKTEDAQKAVTEMHEKTVEGTERPLFVNRALTKAERKEERKLKNEQQETEKQSIEEINLYVKNLDDIVDDKALKEIFDSFGVITSAKVMTFENGRSKGFGFICFENADDGNRALNAMNSKMVGSKPLYVSVAQKKNERRAQLASQYMRRTASQLPGAPLYAHAQNGHCIINAPMRQNQNGFVPGAPVMGMGQPRYPGVHGQQNVQPHVAQNGGYMAQAPNVYGYPPVAPPQFPRAGFYTGPTSAMNGSQGLPQQLSHQLHLPRLGHVANELESTASHTRTQTEAEQKHVVGQHIYNLLGMMFQDKRKVGEITETLMQMETTELIKMLNNPHVLQSKAKEAAAFLHQSTKNLPQAFIQPIRMKNQ